MSTWRMEEYTNWIERGCPKDVAAETVKELWLVCCGLTELSSEIWKLENLEFVSIWGNQLQTLPDAICELDNLQKLHINNNRIEKLPPDFILLNNLEVLRVGYNDLVELPENMGKMRKLKSIDISMNPRLTEFPYNFFSKEFEKEIHLTGTSITSLPSSNIVITGIGRRERSAEAEYYW